MGKSIRLKNDTYIDLTSILFPVGSIYMTTDSDFNPNEQWYGTWEKIEGRMIVGANSTYPSESTGGQTNHSHKYGIAFGIYYNEVGWEGSRAGLLNYNADNTYSRVNKNGSAQSTSIGVNNNASSSRKTVTCTHTDTIADSSYSSNLPPYYSAYIWHRIA